MTTFTAAAIAQQVRAGDLDPVEITDQAIARLEQREPQLHAYLAPDLDYARWCAERVAVRQSRGDDPGRLAGVPISLKDNLAVEGRQLTAGSRILEGYRAPYTGHAAARLLSEGAVLLGRTNMDEFAMGSSTERSAWFPTHNPWNGERVPGGSSGGSAAAVAAGIVPVALGSDTGGSLRQPAALCGVTGFRPSQGAVSRHGLVAHASSLDQVGPVCAHASDAALVFDVLAGGDDRDMTCWPGERPSAMAQTSHLDGVRIALPEEYLDDEVDPRVLDLVSDAREQMDAAGAVSKVLRRGRLPRAELALPAYQVLSAAEASSNLARYDGLRFGPREEADDLQACYGATRAARFGPEVQRRLLLGTQALSGPADETLYARARAARRTVTAELMELFDEFDLIAGPTTAQGAQPLGSLLGDPLEMARCDRLTAPACLAGLPAVTIPCGLLRRGPDKGLPVGLSLMGPPGSDHRVLAAARAFEALRGEPDRCALYGDGG